MSDWNTRVLLGQVAQMLSAIGKKGWGSEELTLLGQASPEQLEEVREYLVGNRQMVPVQQRYWKVGDRIIAPYANESRNGRQMMAQDPRRYGSSLRFAVKELLPNLPALKGQGKFVVIPAQSDIGCFHDAMTRILADNPDLELAPGSCVLHFAQQEVAGFGYNRVVVLHEPIRHLRHEVVFVWRQGVGFYLDTETTNPLRGVGNPWPSPGTGYLLKMRD